MAATFTALAMSRGVINRALKIAAVVGTLLVIINHGQALVQGDIDPGRWFQILLTYCVPYGVSTYASVQALRSTDTE